MIEYKDPIPPLLRLLDTYLEPRIYGNSFPATAVLPSLMIKSAGGTDYTRIQLIARASNDIDAMRLLIQSSNLLTSHFDEIRDLRVVWIERESNPISSVDLDSGKPEAWCYLRMEHIEG